MIHCLNINGRCATVIGQKMYRSSCGYDNLRKVVISKLYYVLLELLHQPHTIKPKNYSLNYYVLKKKKSFELSEVDVFKMKILLNIKQKYGRVSFSYIRWEKLVFIQNKIMSKLHSFKFPIPPIEKQNIIVKFDIK